MDRPTQTDIRNCLIRLVKQRGHQKSICPSEVARAVGGETWRESMDEVRQVAYTLFREGRIEILQKGQVIAPDAVQGPIRLRLATQPASDGKVRRATHL